METVLKIENLVKEFISGNERLLILNNLSLELEKGKKLIITGASGCGKSTLLNLIAGLDYSTSGSITAGTYEVTKLKEEELTEYRKSYIGLIFQFHYLLKDFTALENIMLPAFMGGIPKGEAIEKAKFLLESVGLTQRGSHYPTQLSGGERQRIAVARSLINDPQLILADEPTGSLDEKNSAIVEELLFSLVNNFGKTLILVTHDRNLTKMADTHFSLEKGGLTQL